MALLLGLIAILTTRAETADLNADRWRVLPRQTVTDLAGSLPTDRVLVKSLSDAAEWVRRWQPPTDAAAWQQRRLDVEQRFRESIGLATFPDRTPLSPRITARHERDGFTVENVIFESRPGFPVTANLYRPAGPAARRRPVIVSPIGHFLSAGKTATDVQARCIQLVRLGCVVLVYDAIGQGERMVMGNVHHEAGYALLPLGETIAGWMTWDTLRAIDYVLTLDDVDPARIGVTGNSGGGLNTLCTAALDDRVKAAVVVGFTFEFNNWIKYGGTHCTCTHWPGIFREMEWFEIAGLIAPRALLMLQGEKDNIFPISGARRSGQNVASVYAQMGQAAQVRFAGLPDQPHSYGRPFREVMLGWMKQHLLGEGGGEPIPEPPVETWPERDPRLLCDPEGSVMPAAPTVVDLARQRGRALADRLSPPTSDERREVVRRWLEALVRAPEPRPHNLFAQVTRMDAEPGAQLEKVRFASEDGELIPGLLWRPTHAPAPYPVLVVADARGKSAVADSGWVEPILQGGWAVFAVDLRGRGETLGRYGPGFDTNFRLVANQILSGKPLAGRRAFDLRRALDYLGTRPDLDRKRTAVLGSGDDALSALLAAAQDERITHLALRDYHHSFVSQMKARPAPPKERMGDAWNDPQLNGHIETAGCSVDFGSVIPSALLVADIPDLVAMVMPRRVRFSEARDAGAPDGEALRQRFRRVAVAESGGQVAYAPEQRLDPKALLEWLRSGEKP